MRNFIHERTDFEGRAKVKRLPVKIDKRWRDMGEFKSMRDQARSRAESFS